MISALVCSKQVNIRFINKIIQMKGTLIIILTLISLSLRSQDLDTSAFFKEIDKHCWYPEIVKAQAILETSYFTSRLCRECNNYFGMMKFTEYKYQNYNNWRESVQDIAWWQYRRKKQMPESFKSKEEYFAMLDKIYCFEVNYSKRLKLIINSRKFKKLIKRSEN
jgi:flagellum-specific peptidoglycan hydrolase FlgJ